MKSWLGTSTKKCSNAWKGRETFTLQQSHLLRQRHELLVQIFSLQHMWHNLFKDWKFGATFDYMQRASHAYLPKECIPIERNPSEKLNSFKIPITEDQKLFKKLIFLISNLFAFRKSIKRNRNYKMDWKTCLYIIFSLVKPNTRSDFSLHFRSSTVCILFYQCIWRLVNAKQSTNEIKVFEVETATKNELSSVLEQLNQRHSQRERSIDFDDDEEYFNDTAEEKELSTQFLQMQKNLLIH